MYAPNSKYVNPALKDGAILIWKDANLNPEETRSTAKQYAVTSSTISAIGLQAAQAALAAAQGRPPPGMGPGPPGMGGPPGPQGMGGPPMMGGQDSGAEPRGQKRARAEDFL